MFPFRLNLSSLRCFIVSTPRQLIKGWVRPSIKAATDSFNGIILNMLRKEEKYAAIDGRYIFEPIAEPIAIWASSALQLAIS